MPKRAACCLAAASSDVSLSQVGRSARRWSTALVTLLLACGVVHAGNIAEPADSAQFLTGQASGQWLTSRVIGTTVVSAGNETIGDVSDVVIGPDGRAVALVIGVGGFLGIGEKSVAVPLERIEMQPLLASASEPDGKRHTPDKVILRATRSELQAAPEFRSAPRPLPSLPQLGPSHR